MDNRINRQIKNILFNRIADITIVKDSSVKIMITEINSYMLGFDICIRISNQNDSKAPVIGEFLLLEIWDLLRKSFLTLFAYTRKFIIQEETNPNQSKYNYFILPVLYFVLPIFNSYLAVTSFFSVFCSVITKFIDINIEMSEIKNLHIITSLILERNLVQGLSELKSSALVPLIINPERSLSEYNALLPINRVKSKVYIYTSLN